MKNQYLFIFKNRSLKAELSPAGQDQVEEIALLLKHGTSYFTSQNKSTPYRHLSPQKSVPSSFEECVKFPELENNRSTHESC